MTRGLVVLDIGWTLVSGPRVGPAARIAGALGLAEPERRALGRALMTVSFAAPEEVSAFVERLGPHGERVAPVVESVWRSQEQDARALPGAGDVIHRLHGEGFQLAVVSNIWRPFLESVLRELGPVLERCVEPELRILSFRQGRAKPSPALLQRALDVAGAAAEDAVVIGDSYGEDMTPAIGLGCRTAWLLHRPRREARHLARVACGRAPRPTRVLASLERVSPALVASLLGA